MSNSLQPLSEMSEKEYHALKNSGFMWVLYPEAIGNYEQDCETEGTRGIPTEG